MSEPNALMRELLDKLHELEARITSLEGYLGRKYVNGELVGINEATINGPPGDASPPHCARLQEGTGRKLLRLK
jgi:hypothetical protein